MTEWWQRDVDDAPVPVPRRDVVPEAGFSDPRTVNATPEITSFIPTFRQRRRKIAIGATVVAVGFFASGAVDLVRAASSDSPTDRALGMVAYVVITIKTLVSVIALTLIWRWANQRDPRDIKTPGLTL